MNAFHISIGYNPQHPGNADHMPELNAVIEKLRDDTDRIVNEIFRVEPCWRTSEDLMREIAEYYADRDDQSIVFVDGDAGWRLEANAGQTTGNDMHAGIVYRILRYGC